MARLFPLRSETPAQEGAPRVVDLDDEDADAVFGALSSTTARRIYATLDDEPATPSDVADAIDSSIQNVRYHLEKLEDAGLVEVVDTWYSSRGNEMSVYATADGPLIVTSDRTRAEQLKDALSRFVGGVAALAGASLFVQYGASRFFGSTAGTGAAPAGADGGGDGGTGGDAAGEEDARDGGTDDVSQDSGNGAAGNGNGAETQDETTDGDDVGAFGADGDAEDGAAGNETGGDAASPDGGENATPTDNLTENATDVADNAAEAADAVAGGLPPGLLFFLGGLLVLTAVTAYWYWQTY